MDTFIELYGKSVKTALGFFWKSGWAFVLGYFVSGMIQAFVPKSRLTKYMGDATPRSLFLATAFGAASSSCSFAALAAARALVKKGAHFIVAVAFMFASTNLVIELGILILIFLGWQFLAAEIIGGLVLIVISSVLIRLTYPRSWLEAARERLEEQGGDQEEDFDWKRRISSREGWRLVGHKFVMDWKMVWEDILILGLIAEALAQTGIVATRNSTGPDGIRQPQEAVARAPAPWRVPGWGKPGTTGTRSPCLRQTLVDALDADRTCGL
jgi:uncharacterized membrane protein YraQ (UPF0718 family)